MGSFKKLPRPTDESLAKTSLGWASLVRRALDDVRGLHVCVQDELSIIEQHVTSRVGADPIDRDGESLLAKHFDESIRLLGEATAKLKRLRALVRS